MAVSKAGPEVHGAPSGAAALTAPPRPVVPEIAPAPVLANNPPNQTNYYIGSEPVSASTTHSVSGWLVDKVAPPLISGLIISAIVSVIIARAMERYRGERDHVNRAADALRSQLLALQKATTAYWLSSYDSEKSALQEAEIEFLLQDIAGLASACGAELWQNQAGEGPQLVAELAEQATGPDFGTKTRISDRKRATAVTRVAARFTGRLTSGRREYFNRHKAGWFASRARLASKAWRGMRRK